MTPEEFQAHVCGELGDLKKTISALQTGQTAQTLSLQALQIGQTGAVEHLSRINGSVRELYKRTDESKQDMLRHIADCPVKEDLLRAKEELLNHVASCPVKDEVDILKTSIRDETTAKKVSEKWWKVMQPIIWIVSTTIITAILTLVLSHSRLFTAKP